MEKKEYRGLQTPIGVASYDNVQIKKIEEQLPSVEELKKNWAAGGIAGA